MARRFCFCGKDISEHSPGSSYDSQQAASKKASQANKEVAVDTLTSVPVDIYNNMLKAADRSKVSGAHTLEKTLVRESRGAFGLSKRNSFVHLVRTKTLPDLEPNAPA